MAVSATQVTQEALSYAVITDKNGLVRLLKRNGVQLGNNPSDKEVTVAVLMASAKSDNFKNELASLLTKKVKEAGENMSFVGSDQDFGFTGVDDFQFTGAEDFYKFTGAEDFFNANNEKKAARQKAAADKKAARVTADNPKGKTGAGLLLASIGRALSNEDTINTGIQIGLNRINNKILMDDQNSLTATAKAMQNQQDDMRKNLPDADTGISDTAKYVLIGAGVLALIGIVYLIAKKKK